MKALRTFRELLRARGGSAVVEFALLVPLLLLLLGSVVEVGRVLQHANAVEKGLRAGALMAARSPGCCPLTTAEQTAVANVVMTGSVDGTAPVLVPGWSTGTLNVSYSTITVDTDTHTVIRLQAVVPFTPLMAPSFFSSFGLNDNIKIETAHEQMFLLSG